MPEQRHFIRLTWDQAVKAVTGVGPRLGEALRELRAAVKRMKAEQMPSIYSVVYDYGSSIIGAESAENTCTTLVAPQHPNSVSCSQCDELLSECKGRLPIGIVLTNSAEVYLEYDVDAHGDLYPPFVPLRVLKPGDAFGVFEFLDEMVPRACPLAPNHQWRVSSGARSLFVSSPLRNEQIARKLIKLCTDRPNELEQKAPYRSKEYICQSGSETSVEAAERFNRDNWQFLKAVLSAAKKDARFSPKSSLEWGCELLLISPSWLQRFAAHPQSMAPASQLIHLLKDMGWIQSDHLRRYHSDESELVGALSKLDTDQRRLQKAFDAGYLHRTILHLLAIARGDLPGFVPVRPACEGGPFWAMLEYLSHSGLCSTPGLDGRLPLLLQPLQIDPPSCGAPGQVVYYSFETPSLLGPIKERGNSPRDFMNYLHKAFAVLKKQSFPLGELQNWQFVTTVREWEIRPSVILHVERCGDVYKDFSDQLASQAQWLFTLQGKSLPTEKIVIPNLKNKFLSRCVRLNAVHAPVRQQQPALGQVS